MSELFQTIPGPQIKVPDPTATIDYIMRSRIDGVNNRRDAEDYWREGLKRSARVMADLSLESGTVIMQATAKQQPTLMLLESVIPKLKEGMYVDDRMLISLEAMADHIDKLRKPANQSGDHTGPIIIPTPANGRNITMNGKSLREMQRIVAAANGGEPFVGSDYELSLPTYRQVLDRCDQDNQFRPFGLQGVRTTSETDKGYHAIAIFPELFRYDRPDYDRDSDDGSMSYVFREAFRAPIGSYVILKVKPDD